MEPAAFSLEKYWFDFVQIDMSNYVKEKLSISFDTHGRLSKSIGDYQLIFTIKVSSKNQSDMPFVNIRCNSIFHFDGVENLSEIPEYFYQNSIAIIFPYLRAYISIITVQAQVEPIILPTLNLSSLSELLKENSLEV